MRIVPQTVLSCRGFNGVVLRGLDSSGAPVPQPGSRKRCYLHDLVMPGQKPFRELDKKDFFRILVKRYFTFKWYFAFWVGEGGGRGGGTVWGLALVSYS